MLTAPVVAFLLSLSANATESPAAGPVPTYLAPQIETPPELDGRLKERWWLKAPSSTLFRNNRNRSTARLITTARLVYHDDALFLTFHAEDPAAANPVVQSLAEADTDLGGDDVVEIFFDPGQTRSRYFQLILNTAGHAVVGRNGTYEVDHSITSGFSADGDAWHIEVGIPWKTIGAKPRPGDIWGMNLYRTRQARENDNLKCQLAWHPTGGGYREPQAFGEILFGTRDPQVTPTDAPERQAILRQIVDEVDRNLSGPARWAPEDFGPEAARTRTTRLTALSSRIARLNEPVLVADTDPITDGAVFPWTVPEAGRLDPVIEIAACPEEFEPASVVLFATRPLQKLSARVSEIVNDNGKTLAASTVDIRQVICWYQAGWAHVTQTGRTLVPELLLHDAALIDVDYLSRRNHLNFTGLPQDTITLMPFDLDAWTARQLWLTFQPPADAEPGLYTGWLDITENDVVLTSVPLRLRVYPFELSPSRLHYSLYYRLRPSRTEHPHAAMERMAQEIRNQVEHGINMPSTYVGSEPLTDDGQPMEALEEVTRIYRDLGLYDHPLILVTMAIGTQSTPEQLDRVREMARTMVEWAGRRGYSDVYFQAKDEAPPEIQKKERQAIRAVHDGGGKVFVACSVNFFESLGDLLDMPVVSGPLRPDLAKKVHDHGHLIFSYGNPQAGVELPLTYRRNYGLKLWKAGYDGGFDYEYQQIDPDKAYDDFAEDHYRNHTMAYPALGRPIDTRQWEGWREGVDDVRYLSTLLDALERLEAERPGMEVVKDARRWISGLTGDEPLDNARREMAGHIIAVQSARNRARMSP